MSKQEKTELEWLAEHRPFLNIKAIEDHLGMPPKTIYKYLTGDRALPPRWEKTVIEWVKQVRQ